MRSKPRKSYKKRPKTTVLGRWRRWRDLNPRRLPDLSDFESEPFSRLGTSPYKISAGISVSVLLASARKAVLREPLNSLWHYALPFSPWRWADRISSADPSTTWVHLRVSACFSFGQNNRAELRGLSIRAKLPHGTKISGDRTTSRIYHFESGPL